MSSFFYEDGYCLDELGNPVAGVTFEVVTTGDVTGASTEYFEEDGYWIVAAFVNEPFVIELIPHHPHYSFTPYRRVWGDVFVELPGPEGNNFLAVPISSSSSSAMSSSSSAAAQQPAELSSSSAGGDEEEETPGSSSSAAAHGGAFPKDCAPFVEPIGDYDLVDNCVIPAPPDPINVPDLPPPIPPIDQGCFPLAVSGTFYGPSEHGFVDGKILVSTSSLSDDPCLADFDIGVYIPCFVDISGTGGSVEFSNETETGELSVNVVGGDSCDFELSFDLTLPCPTALTGSTGVARFSPEVTGGTVELTVSPVPDSCDYDLAFDAVLPCPGTITARTELVGNHCLPKPPSISVIARHLTRDEGSSSSSSSSGEATCDFELVFQMDFPCPIAWGEPRVRVITPNSFGAPMGILTIFPEEKSSSSSEQCGDGDLSCMPKLSLDLSIPCQANVTAEPPEVTHEWATPPTFSTTVEHVAGQVCSPKIVTEIDLPCPVAMSPTKEVTHKWFTEPTLDFTIDEGCTPNLDLTIDLPCPAGPTSSGSGRTVNIEQIVAGQPSGEFTNTGFNSDNCELCLNLDLKVPCNKNEFEFRFIDIATGQIIPENEYRVEYSSTFGNGGICNFQHFVDMYVTKGGGDSGFLAKITHYGRHPDSNWLIDNPGKTRPFWLYRWQRMTLDIVTGKLFPYLTNPLDPLSVVIGNFNAINLHEINNKEPHTGVQGNSVDESRANYPVEYNVVPVGGGDPTLPGSNVGNEVVVRMYPTTDRNNVGYFWFQYANASDGVCIAENVP